MGNPVLDLPVKIIPERNILCLGVTATPLHHLHLVPQLCQLLLGPINGGGLGSSSSGLRRSGLVTRQCGEEGFDVLEKPGLVPTTWDMALL